MRSAVVIPGVLVLVLLVLLGAWWLGRPTGTGAVDPSALDGSALVAAEIDPTTPDLQRGEEAELIDLAFEPDRAPRAALAPEEPAQPVAAGGATDAIAVGLLRPEGRALDAATGELLAHYPLELRDARGVIARVRTDAVGAFVAEKPLAPGPLEVRAPEGGSGFDLLAELARDDSGAPVAIELRAPAGPTYAVVVRPDAAPALEGHAPTLVLGQDRPRVRGFVLPGEPARVRFAPLPEGLSLDAPARLHLSSRDGVWRGSQAVRLGRGVQPGTVVVGLVAAAALEVRVISPEGAPLSDAVVTWTPDTARRPRSETTRGDGRVSYDYIEPEAGTLRVRLVRWLDAEIPLVLGSGERRIESVTLTRAPAAGAIRGTVVSDSGTYERDVRLRLVPLEGGGDLRPLRGEVRWSTRSGARVGAFAFDDLPAARFRLEISEDDFFAWEPRRLELEPPRGDLVFVVRDTVAVADVVFEPRREDGLDLGGPFEVRLLVGGETRLLRSRDEPVLVASLPLDTALRWRIDAPGRAAAFGVWTDLSPLPSVGGRERRGAAPVLARGWAQAFRVVRADNNRPIAGATARLDGRDAGVTNAAGRIVLRADTRPGRVTFHHENWLALNAASLVPPGNTPEIESTIQLQSPQGGLRRRPPPRPR
ncbi:MAG: hypothetical protein JNK02_06035 [Planctomycetes bacterium]|nr:hypothetical protein [Planctomycetota bacterium]